MSDQYISSIGVVKTPWGKYLSWARQCKLWQYGLWSFQTGVQNKKYFCLRINILKGNYWIWVRGEVSKSAKIWLSMTKNHPFLFLFLVGFHKYILTILMDHISRPAHTSCSPIRILNFYKYIFVCLLFFLLQSKVFLNF